MRSFAFAAISALVLGASANPEATLTKNDATPACMSDSDASQVAGNFRALIHEPFSTPLAVAALTPDYTDYTDSVIELIDAGCANSPLPLGTATFNSRDAFIAGQSSQPPIPFDILNLWHNCDTVFFRWVGSNPGFVQPEQQVTGLIVLETTYNATQPSQPWQIQTSYSEFNSGAWLYDIGNLTCPTSS